MFKWKENFSVGVKELDEQHKRLFEIGQSLYATLKIDSFDKYDQIVDLLSELHDYTVYHFDTEEKLLISNGVELTSEHKSQHEGFIYKLLDLKSSDIDTSQKEVLIDSLEFVSDWIINHILKTDMEYKGAL